MRRFLYVYHNYSVINNAWFRKMFPILGLNGGVLSRCDVFEAVYFLYHLLSNLNCREYF